ncbi:hypothetical protein [Arsukibacterium indicum]|uniref:Uncharacterized protein n=1 Tax=Arsukibacterium indicum TaxID=2848612 RepID=A0ABS6MI08_9GAMM|nr:hypothetical protein [Arsukibacterium indicum]MBV2127961.1 hypothetical protein [Arsukibacterium indicum]
MTNHKDNPAEIYLVPVFDGEHDPLWCEDPAPGEGMREEDATRYVRADLTPESNAVLAERIADLTRQNSELTHELNELYGTAKLLGSKLAAKPSDSGYEKLLAERDALMAQVERFYEFVNFVVNCCEMSKDHFDYGTKLLSDFIEVKSTPAQYLAEHDREVAARAVEDLLAKQIGWMTSRGVVFSVEDIERYANQLRQQAKGGE